jgi:hypothetical protein
VYKGCVEILSQVQRDWVSCCILVPVRFIVDLDPDTALKLRAMAQAQGRSVEEHVADVLREYTSKYKRPRIPGIGEFDSGETDNFRTRR